MQIDARFAANWKFFIIYLNEYPVLSGPLAGFEPESNGL